MQPGFLAASGAGAIAAVGFLVLVVMLPGPGLVGVQPSGAAGSHLILSEADRQVELANRTGTGPIYRSADALKSACATSFEGPVPCVQHALGRLLVANGTRAAFDVLDALVANNPEFVSESHNIAHALGRTLWLADPDVRHALSTCPFEMASGCFHGVLESEMANWATLRPTQLRGLCSEPQDGTAGSFASFQCLHGLGHGLDMYTGHDFLRALEFCDALVGWWSQSSCYGGVFMENIVVGSDAQRGGLDGAPPTALNPALAQYKESDWQYPCDAVAEKYWTSCYMLQSSLYLHFHAWDFAGAFRMCDAAPAGYVEICYRSVARDISGSRNHDEVQVITDCKEGSPAHMDQCIMGLVDDFINSSGTIGPAVHFCNRDDVPFKQACFRAVGGMAAAIFPDAPAVAAACEAVPVDYRDECTAGRL
jgi:hypothetical protein